jgi:hypothetical protein
LFTQQNSLWVESHNLDILEGNRGQTILLNRKSRSLRYPGVAGVRIRAGTVGSRDRADIGDSILMDLSKGFFAVADSPERQPSASRNFLVRFLRMMEEFSEFDPQETCLCEKFNDIKLCLKEGIEALLSTIPYSESCTFTGVLMVRVNDGLKGILLHTGDSLLFQYTPGGQLNQISETNFWMVGRSTRLYQFDELDIPEGTTFLLATDGISDLVFPEDAGRDEYLSMLIENANIEEIPDKLLKSYDISPLPVDDLAIVTFKPESFHPSVNRIIMSGISCNDISMMR